MSGAAGKRYARALFEIASERGVIDQVEADLGAVVQAIEQNADLSKILLHPHMAADAKTKLVDDLFKNHISAEVYNFLAVLIEKGRETEIALIQQAFVKLANEARGIADAVVTSALPLSEEEQTELAEKFSQRINKKLRLTNVVDPSILGGIVVRIGDRLYDGSIKTKLENFAHQQ